jgi:hypothetical protein
MAKKKNTLPKLNSQRDYITLKLPVGNFTTSFRGAKASGQLVEMKGAFEALDKYVQTQAKTTSIGEAMNDLLDPKLLNKLVPGWNNPIIPDTFTKGDSVKFVSPMFAKKHPGNFEVVKTARKNVYLKMTNKKGIVENVGVPSTSIKKV